MKNLHEYNYDSLEECFVNLFSDVSFFQLLCDGLLRGDVDPRLACLLTDLNSRFDQHITEFSSTFDRITRGAVPPEEEEPGVEAAVQPAVHPAKVS